MNKNKILVITFLLLGSLAAFYQYRKFNIAPKVKFPELQLFDLENNAVAWQSIKRPIFINFFATWCIDCKKEMPALVLLNQKLQSQGIDMILISDEPIELLNKYKNTAAVPMKIYHINASFQSIGINTLPTSYLINSANELVYKATKVQEWTSDKLQNELIKAVK